jgi:hypothetical protein
LLFYLPERRGTDFDVIEDVVPLYNIKLSVKSNQNPMALTLVPQNQTVPFKIVSNRVEFTLEKLNGHQMIAFV